MIKILKTGIFLGGMLLSTFCQSQDVPLGTLPLFYNSSFAGEGDGARINSNLTYSSWCNMNTLLLQTSYDQFVPELGSGIGVNAGHFIASWPGFHSKYSSFGLAIAPKFSLKGKVTISPSLDFQYGSHNSPHFNAKGYSTRAGILVNTSKFFIGYSFNVFSNYRLESLSTSLIQQTRRNTFDHLYSFVQLGYTFQRSQESRFSFTPQLLVGIHKHPHYKWSVFPEKFMVTFRYDKVLWGVSDNGLHIGFQSPKFRVLAINNVERILETEKRENITTLSFRYHFGNRIAHQHRKNE